MNSDKDAHNRAGLEKLLRESLGSGAGAHSARLEARRILGLDETNWIYFHCLYAANVSARHRKPVRLHEEGRDEREALIAYPLGSAPAALQGDLHLVEYSELLRSPYIPDAARGCALWVKKLQAGSGSSMTRTTYLSRELGIPAERVRIGAKGTDLLIDVAHPNRRGSQARIAIAEAQLLQCMGMLDRGDVSEIIFHDVVSSETADSIYRLWDKPALPDPRRSYRELLGLREGLGHSGTTLQAFLPTLDVERRVSFNRTAPGGHALFAVEALRAAYRPELRPHTERPLVSVISNGEDLNSTPDPFILGYVLRAKAPIALVTTERTPVDLKGGLLSLVVDSSRGTEEVSLAVVETAQAAAAGQAELFARMPGTVSTNMTLFNYQELIPLLSREVAEIGEDEFMKVISPDLILNTKEQVDPDGIRRRYVQLEGAMGSTIMNLDRYWRRKHGHPLVHLINVDRYSRTEFFCPIKTAFDYFMQFHSDRFEIDPRSLKLKNRRPGALPQVTLRDARTQDRFYQDVANVLDAFNGLRIRYLDELIVDGQIRATGLDFRGKVRINHPGTGQVDIRSCFSEFRDSPILEDTWIEVP